MLCTIQTKHNRRNDKVYTVTLQNLYSCVTRFNREVILKFYITGEHCFKAYIKKPC